VEVLGHMRSDDSVDALAAALRKGQWWTPFANRRRRAAAAASLRRIGTPGALDALRDASARGASGVRSAARAVLDKD
jgi:HEAT repeat protein